MNDGQPRRSFVIVKEIRYQPKTFNHPPLINRHNKCGYY